MHRKGGIIVNDSDTPSISFRNKQQMSPICLLMYVWQHMVEQKGQGIIASHCIYENNRHIAPLTVAFYVFKIKGLDEDYSLRITQFPSDRAVFFLSWYGHTCIIEDSDHMSHGMEYKTGLATLVWWSTSQCVAGRKMPVCNFASFV